MVCLKVLVMPVLLLSVLIHVQSTAAASKSKFAARTKLSPKLGLRSGGSLLKSGSIRSTSRSLAKTGNRTATSRSSNAQLSALTLELCTETPSLRNAITVEVIGEKDKDGRGTVVAVGDNGGRSPYKKELEDTYPQKTITKIKISGSRNDVICVQSLVVDITIMIDQPTEFKQTCPEKPGEDDLPCKEFGDAIFKPFVCPEKLTELLQSKNQINSVPEDMPTDYTPPVYDITNDMLQASAAIADGVTEGFGKVVKNRIKAHKTAIKMKPLGKISSVVDSFGSFVGALGPVFSIFAGISSIATTFLTPNPFDALAEYMDKQFEQVNERLTDLQGDIDDLERLFQAQGGVLAMADQLRDIRYAVRNYGNMMDRLSSEPVCGKNNLLNLREVDEFIEQYRDDGNVDNKLLDLFDVEFGGVTEAGQGLLNPYAAAYCHSHPEYLAKFANELSFYAYAGSLAHFAYRNLDCIKRGNEDCDESDEDRDEWLKKLHKFLKKAEVFKVAPVNPPRALYMELKSKLEKVIDDETKKVSLTTSPVPGLLDKVYTVIYDKVTNSGDWTNTCVLKNNGRDEGTFIIEVAEISEFNFFNYNDVLNVPWHKRVLKKRFHIVEKKHTDRSYKSVGITCGHTLRGSSTKYCRASGVNVPSTPSKDRVLFLMYSPKMYQAHYQLPSFIGKPDQSVQIDYRDAYVYYDNDGDSGMEGSVHVNCWGGCGGIGESQFALIDNH